jgi:hypothetical protein
MTARMKFLKVLPLAFVLSAGIARADSGPTAADVQKWLAFFDKLVDIMVADKDACPKAAADMNAHFDANKALLEAAAKASSEGKKLPPDAVKHMQESMKRAMPTFMNCQKDEKFQAALDRLRGFGPPHGPPARK